MGVERVWKTEGETELRTLPAREKFIINVTIPEKRVLINQNTTEKALRSTHKIEGGFSEGSSRQ